MNFDVSLTDDYEYKCIFYWGWGGGIGMKLILVL